MEISKHETLWLQNEGAKMLMDLGVKQGDSVIDFGCGKGLYTIPLSQVVGKKGCVYAIERDEDVIAVLLERLPFFPTAVVVKLLKGDDLEMTNTIAARTIDSIFVFDVLQYIKDWDLLFSYFFRVIKPEGSIFIYPAAIPHPGDININLAISKMEEIGFQYMSFNKFRMMHNVDMVDDTVYIFYVK